MSFADGAANLWFRITYIFVNRNIIVSFVWNVNRLRCLGWYWRYIALSYSRGKHVNKELQLLVILPWREVVAKGCTPVGVFEIFACSLRKLSLRFVLWKHDLKWKTTLVLCYANSIHTMKFFWFQISVYGNIVQSIGFFVSNFTQHYCRDNLWDLWCHLGVFRWETYAFSDRRIAWEERGRLWKIMGFSALCC